MKRLCLIGLCLLSLVPSRAETPRVRDVSAPQAAVAAPKREFRGAWIQTIAQSQYAGMDEATMKSYFCQMLDSLEKTGINAVLFQVRPQADAWYKSSYEPWSTFITGRPGKNPGWDPLQFMIEQCHSRCMELHAWINPYRVRLTYRETDSRDPFIRKHRDWMLRYGNALWFDPGIPECRAHIVKVATELVKNYDIDGLHMDDYFYPYPIAGKEFPDVASYEKYGPSQGYTGSEAKPDWRRDNVNRLVFELHTMVKSIKPWVEFGISPFGIHRNLKQDPDGSQTNGLSNFDDLYADALTWMRQGWVDYCIPQLYWETGHPQADYQTLLDWWSDHRFQAKLYIGQDVARSMKPRIVDEGRPETKLPQWRVKLDAERACEGSMGCCFFPASELVADNGGAASILRNEYYSHPALLPSLATDSLLPEPVYQLDVQQDYERGNHLVWKSVNVKDQSLQPKMYAIYRFKKGENENLSDASHLIGLTQETFFIFPPHPTTGEWTYLVTSIDHLRRESAAERIVIRVR